MSNYTNLYFNNWKKEEEIEKAEFISDEDKSILKKYPYLALEYLIRKISWSDIVNHFYDKGDFNQDGKYDNKCFWVLENCYQLEELYFHFSNEWEFEEDNYMLEETTTQEKIYVLTNDALINGLEKKHQMGE